MLYVGIFIICLIAHYILFLLVIPYLISYTSPEIKELLKVDTKQLFLEEFRIALNCGAVHMSAWGLSAILTVIIHNLLS